MKKMWASFLLSVIGLLGLSSCGTFFATGDSGFLIEGITSSVNEEGETVITITFDSEDEPPFSFTLPEGEDGTGIANIESSFDEETSKLTITITYTDNRPPYVMEVPIVQGIDGVGIESIGVEAGEDGATILVFHFTDDREPVRISIPKGEKGTSIASIERVQYDNQDYLVLQITYDDPDREPSLIQIPLSDLRGDGIAFITLEDDGDSYRFVITYTSGFMNEVSFPKPQATKWLYGNGDPRSNQGNDGDFYFNTSEGTIFVKEEGAWVLQMRLEGDSVVAPTNTYIVTFNANGGEFVNSSDPTSIRVEEGHTIPSYSLPLCKKEGFTFVGWWTDQILTPNSGHFTSLTPVMDNLTLYAQYEAI